MNKMFPKHYSSMLLIVFVANFFHLTVQSGLELTYTPKEITADLTRNVSIRCERQGSQVDSSDMMWGFRIAKNTSVGWTDVVDYNQDGSIVKLMGSTSTGNLNPTDWSGYLQVNWEVATFDTLGLFRCEFFGANGGTGFYVDQSPEVMIAEHMNSDTLQQLWDDLRTETSRLASCLSNDGSESYRLGDKIDTVSRHLEQHINTAKTIQGRQQWGRGKYALLMPENGCPANFMNESESFIKFHEQSPPSSGACLQRDEKFHLSKPINEVDGSNCFVHLRFCESLDGFVHVPWPDGKYCINKITNQQCPTGFSEGKLRLDHEDTHYAGKYGGSLFSFDYTSHLLFFCCNENGSHNTPMALPTDTAFYLYRYGGVCQEVSGMTVTQEHIDIDTEDNANGDYVINKHPDIEINSGHPTRIHLCYYSKKNQ